MIIGPSTSCSAGGCSSLNVNDFDETFPALSSAVNTYVPIPVIGSPNV